MTNIRKKLVSTALEWEKMFGVCPAITSAVSEFDAAMILGISIEEYSDEMKGKTAVHKGFDFAYKGSRYQVKANRPSGKPGSAVTLVAKAKNYDWDFLVWILYNSRYEIQEAWQWDAHEYEQLLGAKKRLSPQDYRQGKRLA